MVVSDTFIGQTVNIWGLNPFYTIASQNWANVFNADP